MNIEEAAKAALLEEAVPGLFYVSEDGLERFAKIIRNQALEEALFEIEQGIWFDMTTEQILDALARDIFAMKEQT